MSITLSDFKNRVQSKIHGQVLNKVSDFYGLVQEGAGNLLMKLDPIETRRISQLENALYDQVFSYVCPTDLKKDRIIDVRPQTDKSAADNFSQVGSEEFSLYKTNNTLSIDYNSGVKTIKISKSLDAGVVLNECNSLTENGTWAAGGDAASLEQDTLNKITGTGSLRFDLNTLGSAGYIENSTMTAQDFSALKNNSAVFVWVYLPSAITSINLRWGSSAANYYSRTVTASHDNTAFVTGWNLVRFNWDGATQTGTPTDTAINYLRVTINYTGTATNDVRVDSIMVKRGSIYEVVYYSSYLFRTAAGTWIAKPTSDADLINLDDDSVNILLYEVCELVVQELQGEDSSFDVSYWTGKKKEAWQNYGFGNQSTALKRQNVYYRV